MGTSAKEKAKLIPIDSGAESVAARNKLFREFDRNSNNFLSLADILRGLNHVLELPEFYDTKLMIMRAYQASLSKVKNPNPLAEGLISRGCFKWLLMYIRFYYELWEDFS